MNGVSVVICCHNSAQRLSETLRRLAVQQMPEGVPWEIVVVDNASSDDTAETARRCWPSKASAPLRVVSEPRAGTGNARFTGILEARHEILSFLDDDNWIAPDWISKVFDFFRTHPEAAVVGGPSTAVFEAAPPAWFAGVAIFFAVGDQHARAGDITDERGSLLWTAGMSLRRERVLDLINNGFRFITCVSAELPVMRGEDTELCFALRASGLRIYYEPSLAIQHFMPADRLNWPGALKLGFILGQSGPLLTLYSIVLNAPSFDNYPTWKNSWLFQTLKILRRLTGIVVMHPLACLLRPEGSLDAWRFVDLTGQLATMRTLCGQYKKLSDSIRNAAWAQRGNQDGRPVRET